MTLKLLVADDSVTIQKMVRLAFGGEDAIVEAVSGGDAALEALRRFRPDIVLADALMPGLSGYEVCERIREDPEFSRTPVILLSGTFEPYDVDEAARVRSDGHMTKPFDTSELIDKVHSLVGGMGVTPRSDARAVAGVCGARTRESFLGAGAILDLFGRDGAAAVVPDTGRGETALSEETIRRVADEVVRRLSPEIIREVAWEVVPDLAEVLVRRVVAGRDPEPDRT